jgi:hypothetical protein
MPVQWYTLSPPFIPQAVYPFTDVRMDVSIKSSQQFTTLRRHPALLARLRELNIEEFSPKVRATGYRKIPEGAEAAIAN